MQEKLLWADNLRAIATIAVIILHVASSIMAKYGSVPYDIWMTGNLFDGSVRFCVPVFFMLSGALLFGKDYSLIDFFKKRFSRILFPFVFWSFVYIAFEVVGVAQVGSLADLIKVSKFAYSRVLHGASFHLWYMYTLIGLYFIFPVINTWISNSSKKEIAYYLAVWWGLILLSLPVLEKFKPGFDFRYFTGYLGYCVLGYFLAAKLQYRKKGLPTAILLIGLAITIVGTTIASQQAGAFYSGYYKYLSPGVVLTSAGIFLLFRNFKSVNVFLHEKLRYISKYSYGIYLSHILVLSGLSALGMNWQLTNPIVSIPLTSASCLLLSLLLTMAINRLPFGKYISG